MRLLLIVHPLLIVHLLLQSHEPQVASQQPRVTACSTHSSLRPQS